MKKYATADEKCLFVMCGDKSSEGFRVNASNYNPHMDKIRLYLYNEIKKLRELGYSLERIGEEACGVSGRMVGHWISKSQFNIPTQENYEKLKIFGQRVLEKNLKKDYEFLKKDYDILKKEYDILKKEYKSKRSYFNNTHDNMNNVWHFKRSKYTDDNVDHPTQKPLALCERIILTSSRENENVLDCFGGSGSTLITCESTNRNCYMIELSTYYSQVIINRWENYTGSKAVKIN